MVNIESIRCMYGNLNKKKYPFLPFWQINVSSTDGKYAVNITADRAGRIIRVKSPIVETYLNNTLRGRQIASLATVRYDNSRRVSINPEIEEIITYSL